MGKSKWESLNEIDRRFGRRASELRRAADARMFVNAPKAAPEPPPTAPFWWGPAIALVAIAAVYTIVVFVAP